MSRVAYLDCAGGVAGDMFLAAALDAGIDRPAGFVRGVVARLRLAGVEISWDRVHRGGFRGAALGVRVDPSAHPRSRSLADVLDVLSRADLPAAVVERSSNAFRRLAGAEAEAHGVPPGEAHLHEVGAVDAMVDVVGTVAALDELDVRRLVCSTLPIGTGTVRCAHGDLPLPAPATALLLRGVPVRGVDVAGETVTPTGAALAVTLSERFGPMPAMRVDSVGVGAGAADRPGIANLTRLFVGAALDGGPGREPSADALVEANVDDMAPDLFDHALERLFEAGAVDAFVTPILMKKGRPAHKISALVERAKLEGVLAALFRETTSIGCRVVDVEKHALDRETVRVETPWGPVPVKIATYRGEVVGRKPEHDACRKIARDAGVPLRLVVEAATSAAGNRGREG